MTVLRRLYKYLSRYKAWAVLAFGSMIIFAASQTFMIALIRPVVDDVLTPPSSQTVVRDHPSREEATKQWIVDALLKRDKPEGQRGWLVNNYDRAAKALGDWWNKNPAEKWRKVLFALLILFLVRAVASFFSEYAFQKVGLSTVRDLRNELYERLISQSHRFFSERSTGEMVSRIVSDADAIQAAVSTRMGDLFQESITLMGLIIYVFISNPELAFISLVAAPVLVFPVVHFGVRLRGTTHRSQERMADMTTLLEETIRGVRIVKAFTMENFEILRFREATRRHLGWNLKAQKIQALTSPVMELISALCAIALLAYAHHRTAAGTLTMGAFLSFLFALAAMYAPIKKLNKVNLSVNQALSAAERVFRMLDIENEVQDKPGAVALKGVGRGIVYEDVSFAYNHEPVLRDVTVPIAPGEIVALVGGSGAGKSTFVNLLPRFLRRERRTGHNRRSRRSRRHTEVAARADGLRHAGSGPLQ